MKPGHAIWSCDLRANTPERKKKNNKTQRRKMTKLELLMSVEVQILALFYILSHDHIQNIREFVNLQ